MADCGVLSIAYAYDICSGMDTCEVVWYHTIRTTCPSAWRTGEFSCFPVFHASEGKSKIFYVCRILSCTVCRNNSYQEAGG